MPSQLQSSISTHLETVLKSLYCVVSMQFQGLVYLLTCTVPLIFNFIVTDSELFCHPLADGCWYITER